MMCALHAEFANRRTKTMTLKQSLSRRQFVSSAVLATALSCLPVAEKMFAGSAVPKGPTGLDQVALTSNPASRDQGILILAKSPYSMLHSVPVLAVTIDARYRPLRATNHVIAYMSYM